MHGKEESAGDKTLALYDEVLDQFRKRKGFTVGVKRVLSLAIDLLDCETEWVELQRKSGTDVPGYVKGAEVVAECWGKLVEAFDAVSAVAPDADSASATSKRRELDLARADALRRLGAVRSDQYRAYSDISQHVLALENELEAARTVLSYAERDLQGMEGEAALGAMAGTLARTGILDYAVASLNAISVSTYRIRRYDIAVPLIESAHELVTSAEDKKVTVDATVVGRVNNNYGAIMLGYCVDYGDEGTYHMSPVTLGDDCPGERKGISDILKTATGHYEKVTDGGAHGTWNPRSNYAECLLLSGRIEDARRVLNTVRDEIKTKNQSQSNYMQRCLTVLARVEFAAAKGCPQAGGDKARGDLESAFAHAVEALSIKIRVTEATHIDVQKINNEIVEILQYANRLDSGSDLGTKGREAATDSISKTTDEQGPCAETLPEKDDGSSRDVPAPSSDEDEWDALIQTAHALNEDAARQYEALHSKIGGSGERFLSVNAAVNAIVRGDAISLREVFGLGRKSMLASQLEWFIWN